VRRGAVVAIDLRKAGLVVIDADRHGGPDGVEAWQDLVRQHGADFSAHPMARTPSDGLHIYFSQPAGEPLGNREGSLPEGINVRGAGGYVIAPYCIRGDGTFYELTGTDLIEADITKAIAPVPDWLVDIIRWRPEPASVPPPRFTDANGRYEAYAQAALRGIVADIAATPNGRRNNALNAAAFRLGRMAARGWIARHDIEHGLRFAAQSNGLLAEDGKNSVNATINSGLCAGLAKPADGPVGKRR